MPDSRDSTEIGIRLLDFTKKTHLSLAEISRRSGIKVCGLYRIARGYATSTHNFNKLESFLDEKERENISSQRKLSAMKRIEPLVNHANIAEVRPRAIASGLNKDEFSVFTDILDSLKILDEISRKRVLNIVSQIV